MARKKLIKRKPKKYYLYFISVDDPADPFEMPIYEGDIVATNSTKAKIAIAERMIKKGYNKRYKKAFITHARIESRFPLPKKMTLAEAKRYIYKR